MRRRLLSLLLLAATALPLGAAGRPLAPRTLGPTHHAGSPAAAYAGGRFLTVWREVRGVLGLSLQGAFSDAGGARLSTRSFTLDVPPTVHHSLIGTGNSFTLFWRSTYGQSGMADVDLEGRVTNRRPLALPYHFHAKFAWNGTHFLGVLRTDNESVTVVLLDRNGRNVLPPAVVKRASTFDVVAAGDRLLALTSGVDRLTAHEVTPAGFAELTVVDSAATSPLGHYKPRRVTSVAAGDGGVLVVWGTSSDGTKELKSAIVGPDGTATRREVIVSGTLVVEPLAVLRTGAGYVAAFRRGGNLYRVRLDPAGAPIGNPELVQSEVGDVLHPATSADTILLPFASGTSFPGSSELRGTTPAPNERVVTIALPVEGQPRLRETLSITYSRQSQPILGAGGGGVYAAWTEFTGLPSVRGTAVDAAGEPLPATHIAPASLAAADTAWNGVHHLVLHRQDTSRLLATRVAADGTVVDTEPVVLVEMTEDLIPEAAVVWTGELWLVVWSDGRRLQAIRLSPGGEVLSRRTLDVHQPLVGIGARYTAAPALAFDGHRVLLAWTEAQTQGCTNGSCFGYPMTLFVTRLTRNGFEYDRAPVDLGIVMPPSLSVASSGSEFMVIAGEKLRVLEGDGRLRVTAARDLVGWRALGDVTWDGASYAVALRYSGAPTSWYLRVLRLDRAGNDAAVPRATATLTPDLEAAPSIAAPFAGNALIGVQEGTADEGAAAAVYLERDLPPLPAPPAPPRNVAVRRLTRFEVEVTWEVPSDGPAGAYVIEQLFPDGWVEVARVPGDALGSQIVGSDPAPLLRVRAFNAAGLSEPAEAVPAPRKRRTVRR